MIEFQGFPKIARLSRNVIISEKIDGTNGVIHIGPLPNVQVEHEGHTSYWYGPDGSTWGMWVGSRTRWIGPGDDNYGFAAWAQANTEELKRLGPGTHFGEWWGAGIQRNYGLSEKRWSLFNVSRWSDDSARPTCCHVVPVLYEGPFLTDQVQLALAMLKMQGSAAAPGFMKPEGVVIYHAAANRLFKKTLLGDEEGKHTEAHPKKEKVLRPPKDPSKGGRRIGVLPFEGLDRRTT